MTLTLSIKPSRHIITETDIKSHFTNDKHLQWVPLKALMAEQPEQCVDGRSQKGIIGTPGGNMGEFILALDAAEKVTGITLRPKEIQSLFDKYLKEFGAFYMHTDTHALHHLNLDITIPPKTKQAGLLKKLTQPENVGCGHLKLMLMHPDEYGVRPELIKTAMQTFYKALWSGKNLEFVILDADHAESAVTTVLVEDSTITGSTEIPTVSSMGSKHQMFIVHPQAINFMRQEVAKTIVTRKWIYGLTKRHLNRFIQIIVDRGNHVTRLTLSYLALGLPHYTVTIMK